MFAELNAQLKTQTGLTDPIFELHPAQLYGWLEAVWETWRRLDEGSLTTPPILLTEPGSKKAAADAASAVGPRKQLSDTAARATVVALGNVDRRSVGTPGQVGVVLSDTVLALLRSRDPGFGPVPRVTLDVVQAATQVLNTLLVSNFRGFATTPWLHLMYAY